MTIQNTQSDYDLYRHLLTQFQQIPIETAELTFFEVGLRGHYENPTTELLCFFLNPHNGHNLSDTFLQGYLSALNIDPTEAGSFQSASTEIVTINNSRLDLVVVTDNYALATECKIYHHQNNPFDQYEKHIQYAHKEKKASFWILCIDGKTSVSGWQGLSYATLAEHIRPFLANTLITNPFNKWAILAREFLLHLSRLGENGMNLTESDLFLIENQSQIIPLLTAQENLQRKLQTQISALKEHIITAPPHCSSVWVYNKNCLVFDFTYSDPITKNKYSFAIDCRLYTSGWTLVLLSRNSVSSHFLASLLEQSAFHEHSPIKRNQELQYELSHFRLEENLTLVAEQLELWFQTLNQAVTQLIGDSGAQPTLT